MDIFWKYRKRETKERKKLYIKFSSSIQLTQEIWGQFWEEGSNAFKPAFVQIAFVQNPLQDNEQCFKSQPRGNNTLPFKKS